MLSDQSINKTLKIDGKIFEVLAGARSLEPGKNSSNISLVINENSGWERINMT